MHLVKATWIAVEANVADLHGISAAILRFLCFVLLAVSSLEDRHHIASAHRKDDRGSDDLHE